MRLKPLKLSAAIMLGFGLTGLKAQNTIPATGGNATGSGGSASYSVGQVLYTTNSGTNGSLAIGVQQAYEITVVTGIEEAKGIILNCSAYPNPATDILNLKVDASISISSQSMNYQLLDLNGKLLETKNISSNETSIITSNLLPATYFLKVTQNDKEVKTFKIIKN